MPDYSRALRTVLTELLDGAGKEGFVLNPGDEGLLKSLDRLSVAEAQPIAGHVDHLRYGLSVINRWQAGDGNAFASAVWGPSWQTKVESENEWLALRHGLQKEAYAWRDAIAHPREDSEMALTGVVASVAHLAYHLGAIRQMVAATKGPKESH